MPNNSINHENQLSASDISGKRNNVNKINNNNHFQFSLYKRKHFIIDLVKIFTDNLARFCFELIASLHTHTENGFKC